MRDRKFVQDDACFHVEWFVSDRARNDVSVRFANGQLQEIVDGKVADAIPLGSVALVDGLVNAHTHLEFSGIRSPIPMQGRFTDWIRAVIRYRAEHPVDVVEAIESGIRESWQTGTTLVGEIATRGWEAPSKVQSQFRGVVFQEVLGLLPARIEAQVAQARSHLQQTDDGFFRGVSPHAPYSTHLDVVRYAATLSRETNCSLTMHLAETRGELELLNSRTGEFRDLLTDFGIWQDDPRQFGHQPRDYLEILAEAPRSLIVHGNYLTDDDLQFLSTQPQMTLVYCPRTHAAFGHAPHPWRRARELGVAIAIGTDSRASNPDLSLFAELQFIAAGHPDLSHIDLLQLGSTAGCRALGLPSRGRNDFTLIRLADPSNCDPKRHLFEPRNKVSGTIQGGRWRWTDDELAQQLSRP